LLVAEPTAKVTELKVGLPSERKLTGQRLAGHPCRSDQTLVIAQQVLAERLEVTPMMNERVLGHCVAHAVGIVLVEVFSFGQAGDGFPVIHLKGTAGSGAEREPFICGGFSSRCRSSDYTLELFDQPMSLANLAAA